MHQVGIVPLSYYLSTAGWKTIVKYTTPLISVILGYIILTGFIIIIMSLHTFAVICHFDYDYFDYDYYYYYVDDEDDDSFSQWL